MSSCERVDPGIASRSFLSPRPTATNVDGRPKVYLHPGHAYIGLSPTAISCFLGSCVAVCLWDSKLKIGGAIHYLLPGEHGVPSRNSGTHGIGDLIARMGEAGAHTRNIVGSIFGGACVLLELRSHQIGMRNIAAARASLSGHRIAVLEENVGGNQGRKVTFLTDTGETRMRLIEK